MRWSLLVVASLAAMAISGCTNPAAPATAPEGAVGEPAPAPANFPRTGPTPALREGSAFAETAWGFVHRDFQPPDLPKPTILNMDGYEGASAVGHVSHYVRMADGALIALSIREASDGYVYVRGSVRGTGCSGGAFELFDQNQAHDGRYIVEWLAHQEWSLPKIGLAGGSYNGMMAFLIAAADPPSLGAVWAGMLVADLYRDIAYPGGVPNDLFPRLWMHAYRPAFDRLGTFQGATSSDEVCAQNAAMRPPHDITQDALVQAWSSTDGNWWRTHSLLGYADAIRAPITIGQAWQDEQTGPRGGPLLFESIHPKPVLVEGRWVEPKRLVASNGGHLTAGFGDVAWDRWFDHWLLGNDTGLLKEPPVRLGFGARVSPVDFSYSESGALYLESFPSKHTTWWRLHLDGNAGLSEQPPPGATLDYVTGASSNDWTRPSMAGAPGPDVDPIEHDLPLALRFTSPTVQEPLVIAGPIVASLNISTTAPDTDLYVALHDVGPDGTTQELARGLLRASHRAMDPGRSWYNDNGTLIRPYHSHTNPQSVQPGAILRYDIEVSPLAHIVYPNHALQLEIATPPRVAGLWGYDPVRPAGVNTVHLGPENGSSILLPLVAWQGDIPAELGCGEPDGYRCVSN